MNRRQNILSTMMLLAGIFLTISNFSFGKGKESNSSIPKDGSIYLDPEFGNDKNGGTKESPLRTLYEAACRVNQANGKGAITINLSEGIYGLDATVTFHAVNWHFTKEERLTIRAEILPDDTVWNPAKMPVIVPPCHSISSPMAMKIH